METGTETCSSTALDLESVPPRESSIVDSQKLTVDCGLSLPLAVDNATLKFELPQSRLLADFYQMELELAFQIVDDEGVKIADVPVGPVCGALSVIDRLEVWCAGRPLKIYDSYNYLYHLMTLLKSDKSWMKTLGAAGAFYPDLNEAEGPGVYVTNKGALARKSLAVNGKVYNTISRLFVPILTQQRFVPCDQANNWQIHCHLASSNFALIKDPEQKKQYKLLIHKAKLHLVKCQLSEAAAQQIEARNSLSYPVTDYANQTYTFYAGTSVRTTPTCSLETFPKRIYVVFLDQAAGEDQTKNSFYYQNFQIESISLNVSGKIWSLDGMLWDRAIDYNVAKAYYNTVYTSLGATKGFVYEIKDFVEVASIFCFDCTYSGHSANCDMISVPPGPAGYSVTVKFKEALKNHVVMRVICEYDTVMNVQNNGLTFFSS